MCTTCSKWFEHSQMLSTRLWLVIKVGILLKIPKLSDKALNGPAKIRHHLRNFGFKKQKWKQYWSFFSTLKELCTERLFLRELQLMEWSISVYWIACARESLVLDRTCREIARFFVAHQCASSHCSNQHPVSRQKNGFSAQPPSFLFKSESPWQFSLSKIENGVERKSFCNDKKYSKSYDKEVVHDSKRIFFKGYGKVRRAC